MKRTSYAPLMWALLIVATALMGPEARGQSATDTRRDPVQGSIQSIDNRSRTLKVRRSDGSLATLSLSPSVTVMNNGQAQKFEDLQVGQSIAVPQGLGNSSMVSSIEVTPSTGTDSGSRGTDSSSTTGLESSPSTSSGMSSSGTSAFGTSGGGSSGGSSGSAPGR